MNPVNKVNTPTSPRRYQIGDIIPGHGTVTDISLTAYLTDSHSIAGHGEGYRWVPFYGPNGVDHVATIEPLVVLS